MKPRLPKPTSGRLDRSFFFMCPEVGLEFRNLEVSRGPFRISTLRCPEVRLEFHLCGVQRSDQNFNMRCPEVGLEFQLEVSRGRIRIVRNSRSRCGCGGAQVFECVHDLMGRIERRRLTLDDCDDRRRDRVRRERAEVEI